MCCLSSKKDSPRGTRSKTVLEAVGLFFILLGCILAMTWPWGSYIDHAFVTHWDPPLHAWKVIGIAKAILSGHILPPETNMNVYYPHPGSLYFESLYWPQAVVAAFFLKLFSNPILAFHLSYLFFWALSGVCFWFFLREIGVRRLLTYVGAIFFTIMPYRMSYLVEFNMQMCFGVPLVLLFTARYFKNPNIWNAALASLSLCLQAVSELYQAVFLSLSLLFFVMPLVSGRWNLFKSLKKFWIPLAVAGAIGGVFVLVFLWPYLLCLDNSLTRRFHETYLHRLEPFSYLVSNSHTRWDLSFDLTTKECEMCSYATLPVLLLTAAFLVWLFRRHLSKENRKENCIAFFLRCARIALLLSFFVIAAVNYNTHELLWPKLFSQLPNYIVVLSLLIPLFTTYHSDRERILDGLFNVAVFSFFMSLGPRIQCGNKCPVVSNKLYVHLYKHSSILHGFRVVSRFSFLVLIFDIVAASVLYSKLIDYFGAKKKYGKLVLQCAQIPLLAIRIWESIPRKRAPLPMKAPESSVIKHLDERENPYVLAIIPFGCRDIDSQDMFLIGEEKRILIWAWGGTFPGFTQKYRKAYGRLFEDPRILRDYLNTLWPECFILLHRQHLKQYYCPEKQEGILEQLRTISTKVDDDNENLALLKPMPSDPSTNVLKLIRHDFLKSNSSMHFKAALAPDTSSESKKASIIFNDKKIEDITLTTEQKEFTIPYPYEEISIRVPNAIWFICDEPISIFSFNLVP